MFDSFEIEVKFINILHNIEAMQRIRFLCEFLRKKNFKERPRDNMKTQWYGATIETVECTHTQAENYLISLISCRRNTPFGEIIMKRYLHANNFQGSEKKSCQKRDFIYKTIRRYNERSIKKLASDLIIAIESVHAVKKKHTRKVFLRLK